MDLWVWILIAAAIVVVVLLGTAAIVNFSLRQRRRSRRLRDQFGPAYDDAVRRHGSRAAAERDLEVRQSRVERLRLRTLTSEERSDFQAMWTAVQGRFVDDPESAVSEAARIVERTMEARGYPLGDLEQRVADISVEFPSGVEHYRSAVQLSGTGATEDRRRAMLHFRELFHELTNTGLDIPAPEGERRSR
jgi:hypothetical protein